MESALLRTLHQVGNVKVRDIIKDKKKYPGFQGLPKTTIYRHAKMPLDGSAPFDRRKLNPGRPRKMSASDVRLMKRNIEKLRREYGTFNSVELQHACSMESQISNSGFRKYLHKAGYRYLRTRKKGLLKRCDLIKRLRFVRKVKRNFKNGNLILWTKAISMYVDGVGFEYKKNPYQHSKTPQAREWRRPNEGLRFGCTTKGKKEERYANDYRAIKRDSSH